MLGRLLITTAILFVIDLYAYQALRTALSNSHDWVKWSVGIFYWMVFIVTIAFMMGYAYGYIEGWNKDVLTILRAFIFILYASKFLVAIVIFVDDLRRLITWMVYGLFAETAYDASRSKFLSQLGLLMGGFPLITLTYGMLRNAYRYRVYREQINLSGIPDDFDGLKIVQISDIHSGSFTRVEPVKEAVRIINDLKPDVVFFTGDLVNSVATEMEPYIDIFKDISAKYGVYSIRGNHDYGDYHRWSSKDEKEANFRRFREVHAELGWDLLLNENRVVQIGDSALGVIGVENYSAHPRFQKYGDLAKAYEGMEVADLKILLSHDPSHWSDEVTDRFQDIALTLSGHTHGFQFGIEIPGWLKWSPSQYMYKHWAGLYEKAGQYLYVNRGLGFLGYPGRVGILPEITFLRIRKKG